MYHKKQPRKSRNAIIAEIKEKLKKTLDPIEREHLQQRLHHFMQQRDLDK
jgi:hypothetical protein